MDAHVETLLANGVIGWVYHPDKFMEVLVAEGTGCEVQSSDTDYSPRQRRIDYPREIKIDPDIYRIESFVFEGLKQHMAGEREVGVVENAVHLGLSGIESSLMLHVWSRERGRKEAKLIMAEMHRILDDADLTLTGHVLVSLRFKFSHTVLDADGVTYHGIADYHAMTHTA